MVLRNLKSIYLITSWFNISLYSIEVPLTFFYFYRFPKDSLLFRTLVTALLTADTVSVITTCATSWITSINFPDFQPGYNFWTTPVGIIATVVCATFEQTFLIYRVFALSRSKAICGVLMLLVLAHVVFSMVAAIHVAIHPDFTKGLGSTATTVAFCISVALDISIPVALIWQLRQFNSVFQTTKNIIRRITIQAISSGSVVALAGIIFIILFWTSRSEFLIISGILGRLYSLTILVNLLGRKPREIRKSAPNSSNTDRVSNVADVFNLSSSAGRRADSVKLEMTLPHSRDIPTSTESPRAFKNHMALEDLT